MTRLEELLDQMRSHLMQAEFAAAAALAPEVEAALAALPATQTAALLLRIQAKATRNAACLEGARRGLKSARQRADDIRRAARGLNTYDIQGRPNLIGQGGRMAGRL